MNYWNSVVLPALCESQLVAIGHHSILLLRYEATTGSSHVEEWQGISEQRSSSRGATEPAPKCD